MEPVLTRNYTVRALEADPGGFVRPVSLINYLQEAALDHAAELGVSVHDLIGKDLTWVLSRYLLRISRYPKARETLQVQTWPSAREGMYTFRDFEISVGREVVAAVTSSWALLDLNTRRPVRLAEALPDYPLHRHRVLEFPSGRLPSVDESDLQIPFRVRRADLDINRHVNSAVYVEWGLESVPAGIAETFRPSEIEIAYRAEAFYGETVVAAASVVDEGKEPVCLHRLTALEDGREVVRMRSRWREF